MLRSAFVSALFSVLMLLPAAAMAAPEIGKAAPDFTGIDADGKTVKLSDFKGSIVVLEWNNPGCPFVHKHYDSGNMQQLQSWATGKGVVWLTVNSSTSGRQGNMTGPQAKDYIADKKIASTHYLLDPDGVIGLAYGAKTTPHMFVIDASGNVAYMGAIDDQPTPDPKSLEGAHNYVRAAIESLMAAKPVEVSSTQPYGCSVKYSD